MGRTTTFNISVQSSTSIIATAAAGMSSNSWLQLTSGNLPTGLGLFTGQGGSSGIATHYAQNIARDTVAKKLYWIGCDHGADTIFLVFDEATNAWTEQATSVPWGIEAGGTTAHGYNHTVWTPSNSKLWHRPFATRVIRRWDGGTTWGTVDFSANAAYAQAANGCAFHPNIGSNGSIIIFQNENGTSGMLMKIDPVTGTVTTIIDQSTHTLDPAGDPHNFAVYNPTSDVVFFGGGNGQTTCWTINASSTVTAKTAIPGGLGTVGPATGAARIFANPTNGNFIAILNSSTWYDFDVSGNSWTARGGTASILSANTFNGSVDGVIGVDMRDYGVLCFVKAYSVSSDAQMWLFKP